MTRFIDRDCLDQLRKTVDWKRACQALDIQFDTKRSKNDDWWGHSPFTEDKTPSFHVMPNKGVWYCFSTKQGGGIIELVQNLKGLNCFEAGQWLIDESVCPEPATANSQNFKRENKVDEPDQTTLSNSPIRQSLIPNLRELGTHQLFQERGIGEATCEYLGCGYLPKGRSSLKKRIVFQVRGLKEKSKGDLVPTILSHIGRACDETQIEKTGKWLFYAGFQKRLELYNIDHLLTDPEALSQIQSTGHVIIVEGPFDVAKLIEAGIKNVIACFGSDLAVEATPKIQMILKYATPQNFLLWFDRDNAGITGTEKAMDLLEGQQNLTKQFDWEQTFGNQENQTSISNEINDPCDMSIRQLQWLRSKQII